MINHRISLLGYFLAARSVFTHMQCAVSHMQTVADLRTVKAESGQAALLLNRQEVYPQEHAQATRKCCWPLMKMT